MSFFDDDRFTVLDGSPLTDEQRKALADRMADALNFNFNSQKLIPWSLDEPELHVDEKGVTMTRKELRALGFDPDSADASFVKHGVEIISNARRGTPPVPIGAAKSPKMNRHQRRRQAKMESADA